MLRILAKNAGRRCRFSVAKAGLRTSSLPFDAHVIDGKAIAEDWEISLAAQAAELEKVLHRKPGLAMILAGERPDSTLYVRRKQEACKRVGIESRLYTLPDNVVEADVQTIVEQLSNDIDIDGILVQLPLPGSLKEEGILENVSAVKDVDGLSPVNVGRMLMRGDLSAFKPCPALACIELLKRSNLPIRNKKVVVVGDSNTVGLPLAVLFRDEGAAAVTICHRVAYNDYTEDQQRTEEARRAAAEACAPSVPSPSSMKTEQQGPDAAEAVAAIQPQHKLLPDVCRTADILVVAVGHAELVTGDWVKPGAVVLDVGINVRDAVVKGKKNRLIGDVAFKEVSKVASAITPVPGGVGPMTIASLLHNTLEAARMHAKIWQR